MADVEGDHVAPSAGRRGVAAAPSARRAGDDRDARGRARPGLCSAHEGADYRQPFSTTWWVAATMVGEQGVGAVGPAHDGQPRVSPAVRGGDGSRRRRLDIGNRRETPSHPTGTARPCIGAWDPHPIDAYVPTVVAARRLLRRPGAARTPSRPGSRATDRTPSRGSPRPRARRRGAAAMLQSDALATHGTAARGPTTVATVGSPAARGDDRRRGYPNPLRLNNGNRHHACGMGRARAAPNCWPSSGRTSTARACPTRPRRPSRSRPPTSRRHAQDRQDHRDRPGRAPAASP